jgi:Tfp pilus assembly protein PilW
VRNTGFSIVELMLASAITMAVVGAILAVVNPAQLMFRAQGDAADLHQRLRAAADTMSADVRAATAVRPYRVGAIRDDAAIGSTIGTIR